MSISKILRFKLAIQGVAFTPDTVQWKHRNHPDRIIEQAMYLHGQPREIHGDIDSRNYGSAKP
jgi:hypothetical protein